MAIYFTADQHFKHRNIIKYCNRPFSRRDTAQMDKALVWNWNKTVRKSDKVYVLGDFAFGNHGRFITILNGYKYFINGNHDGKLRQDKPKNRYMICHKFLWFGRIKLLLLHRPPWQDQEQSIDVDVDIILCGHIHDKWKSQMYNVSQRHVPVVNVGVDVWGFKPVSLRTILKYYKKEKLNQK